jgi:hypothetical protein
MWLVETLKSLNLQFSESYIRWLFGTSVQIDPMAAAADLSIDGEESPPQVALPDYYVNE